MDKIASSIMAALCFSGALPAWAQPHALDGTVTFSDLQVTAAAIDPGGPAAWVNRTAPPFAHLYNYLCFPPDFCQQAYAGHGPDDANALPLNTSLSYRDSWTTGEAREEGVTGLAAHLAFTPGALHNAMSADADYAVPNFDVGPNTIATFTIRLHGALSAGDAAFPDLGRLFGETQFVPSDLDQWQPTYFSLLLAAQAQSFDRFIVATLRNDTADVENVWWYLHSGLDLQLFAPVPEPATWLMLLAGLALLLSGMGAMPDFVSLKKKI